jgi:hypothetical protein
LELKKYNIDIQRQTPFCPLDIFPPLGEEKDGGLNKIIQPNIIIRTTLNIIGVG